MDGSMQQIFQLRIITKRSSQTMYDEDVGQGNANLVRFDYDKKIF